MPSTFCSVAPFPLSEPLGSGIRPGKTCDAIASWNQRLNCGPAQAESLGSDWRGSLHFAIWHLLSPPALGMGCQISPQNRHESELLRVTIFFVCVCIHNWVSVMHTTPYWRLLGLGEAAMMMMSSAFKYMVINSRGINYKMLEKTVLLERLQIQCDRFKRHSG